MRAGAKLRFQHIFREMRASGAKKGIRVSAKLTILFDFNPISWRQAAHFLFFFVCVYITSFLFSLSCSYLLPFVSFSGYSSVSFSFPYLLFSLFFYSLFTIFSDFPAYLPHLLERFWNVPERLPHHFFICVLVCSMVFFSCLKRMKVFANVCENKNLTWTTCKIVSLLSFWSYQAT